MLLPGTSHGWRSLVGCSPWGHYESDMTERLPFHFSLSCIGEGNGNPLQRSCLENPRDGRTWWAAVCGFAQSWTRLKRLSSDSSLFLLGLGQSLAVCAGRMCPWWRGRQGVCVRAHAVGQWAGRACVSTPHLLNSACRGSDRPASCPGVHPARYHT